MADGSRRPGLVDQHGRIKHKLRLSLTDRCNFRCRYCMPEQPQWIPKQQFLKRAELLALVTEFVHLGIRNIRLTGGEPLLRPDLAGIVADLNTLRPLGLERISMTTNGSRLAEALPGLRRAGLDDLNISLDSVDAQRFRNMTGAELAPVMAGIDAAVALGVPFKLNTVLVRGHNEQDILPLTDWALRGGMPLRFIEYMPLDAPGRWQADAVVSEQELLDTLRTRYQVERLPRSEDPATLYTLDGDYRVGVISTISNPFCSSCDRLRLTVRGELYTCLFARQGTDLAGPMRSGQPMSDVVQQIARAVWNKEAGYAAHRTPVERPITMHTLGG
ncbi:GTP 3',8-cyclase MoaA [Solimonas sp. K1W22B-7]|uniref:GTP 3',8-cyclase MoaA n=1 Tax=Solimonas sp. K1W22B-7 TaxID=2303331 RepID=UPI000E334C72|nr:GTP 3',8-cyclase MoaA [Solimonas sp. K1W22B-7]AXQ28407.1 GTP 3',8-cyclase MoaA [Solimonas sp. K1W22B-7]